MQGSASAGSDATRGADTPSARVNSCPSESLPASAAAHADSGATPVTTDDGTLLRRQQDATLRSAAAYLGSYSHGPPSNNRSLRAELFGRLAGADGVFFDGDATTADPFDDDEEDSEQSTEQDELETDATPAGAAAADAAAAIDAADDRVAQGDLGDAGLQASGSVAECQSITTEQLDEEFALFFANTTPHQVLQDSFGYKPVSSERHRFLRRVDSDGVELGTNELQFENIKEMMRLWYRDDVESEALYQCDVEGAHGIAAKLAMTFERRRGHVGTAAASEYKRQKAVLALRDKRQAHQPARTEPGAHATPSQRNDELVVDARKGVDCAQPQRKRVTAISLRQKRLVLRIREVFQKKNDLDTVGFVSRCATCLTGLAANYLLGMSLDTAQSSTNLKKWEKVAKEAPDVNATTLRVRRSTKDAPGTLGGELLSYFRNELQHRRAVRRCDITDEARRLFQAQHQSLPSHFVDRWMGRNHIHAFSILRKTTLSVDQLLGRLRALHTFIDDVWASAEAAKLVVDMVVMFDEVPFCYSGTESFKCLGFAREGVNFVSVSANDSKRIATYICVTLLCRRSGCSSVRSGQTDVVNEWELHKLPGVLLFIGETGQFPTAMARKNWRVYRNATGVVNSVWMADVFYPLLREWLLEAREQRNMSAELNALVVCDSASGHISRLSLTAARRLLSPRSPIIVIPGGLTQAVQLADTTLAGPIKQSYGRLYHAHYRLKQGDDPKETGQGRLDLFVEWLREAVDEHVNGETATGILTRALRSGFFGSDRVPEGRENVGPLWLRTIDDAAGGKYEFVRVTAMRGDRGSNANARQQAEFSTPTAARSAQKARMMQPTLEWFIGKHSAASTAPAQPVAALPASTAVANAVISDTPTAAAAPSVFAPARGVRRTVRLPAELQTPEFRELIDDLTNKARELQRSKADKGSPLKNAKHVVYVLHKAPQATQKAQQSKRGPAPAVGRSIRCCKDAKATRRGTCRSDCPCVAAVNYIAEELPRSAPVSACSVSASVPATPAARDAVHDVVDVDAVVGEPEAAEGGRTAAWEKACDFGEFCSDEQLSTLVETELFARFAESASAELTVVPSIMTANAKHFDERQRNESNPAQHMKQVIAETQRRAIDTLQGAGHAVMLPLCHSNHFVLLAVRRRADGTGFDIVLHDSLSQYFVDERTRCVAHAISRFLRIEGVDATSIRNASTSFQAMGSNACALFAAQRALELAQEWFPARFANKQLRCDFTEGSVEHECVPPARRVGLHRWLVEHGMLCAPVSRYDPAVLHQRFCDVMAESERALQQTNERLEATTDTLLAGPFLDGEDSTQDDEAATQRSSESDVNDDVIQELPQRRARGGA